MSRHSNSPLAADTVVVLAGAVAALHVGKLPPALPVLREALGMTLVEAGFLLSIVQLAGMAAGVAVGVAADGYGWRRSMLTGLAILAASSALGGFAREAWQLMALRAVEGFGFLLAVLPVPALLRSMVPARDLARKLGLWAGYMPAGTALVLLCGPWVMAVAGWRGLWWTLAALTALMLAWAARAIPPALAWHAANGTRWLARLRTTLASRGPWLVALTFATYSCQWLSIIGFLPTMYAQGGLSVSAAGALTALVAAVNVAGNVVAGRMLHRGASHARVIAFGFATMLVCAVLAFGFPQAPLALRFAAVLVLSGVGGLVPGTLFALAVKVAPGVQYVSTTVGWMQQFSALGQFAGPPLVAWVAAVTGGWQWTWTVTGGACIAGLALAVAIGRLDGRSAP